MIIIKVMKDTKIWKSAAALLFAALLLPACSDDDGGTTVTSGDGYATLVVTIGSRDAVTATTRAESVSEEDDDEYERYIDKWWLVVTRKDGDGFVVDREPISSENYSSLGVTATQPSGDDSEWQVGLTVEIGQTYKFYALANLDYLKNGSDVVSEIEGLQAGNTFEPEKLEAEMQSMDSYTGTTYIPMTSYGYVQEITEGTTELAEPIALIRLLGKVTLTVKNLTSEAITLNGLSMGNFRSGGNIFLFPYDVDKGTNILLQTGIEDSYNPSVPSGNEERTSRVFVSSETTIESGATNAVEFTKYVNETDDNSSESGGEVKDFAITTNIDGRNPNEVESGFSFIRRNDWLQIPIQISDVDATITINQKHMPIGGIPTTYKMQSGAIIPIVNFATSHAGDIDISFSVTSVSNINNPVIRYETTAQARTEFTTAVVTDNEDDLLINVPDDDELEIENDSFTVTLQELAKEATATITLTLVIEDGDNTSRQLIIPYEIKITNKE